MDLGMRRLLLVVLSVVGGVVGLFGTLAFINLAWDAHVSFRTYGPIYQITTVLPLALLIAVWLDVLLDTQLLKTTTADDLAEEE